MRLSIGLITGEDTEDDDRAFRLDGEPNTQIAGAEPELRSERSLESFDLALPCLYEPKDHAHHPALIDWIEAPNIFLGILRTSARQRGSFIDSESSDQFFMRDRLTRASLVARRRQTTVEVVIVGLVVKGGTCEHILQRNSRLAQRLQHARGASQFLFRERINDLMKHFACSHDPSQSENSLGRCSYYCSQ